MINKKFSTPFFLSVMIFSLVLWAYNCAFSEEEKTFKHSVKPLAQERQIPETIDLPMCPSCKKGHLGPMKGKTVAPMGMVCPDCKKGVSELDVHHCDECDKDALVCVMCKEESAKLKAPKESKCPKCKQVRSRPPKGKAFAKWEMKCPDCKKKTHEWTLHHCDECDIDFLSCPICDKEKKE
ncbi:MAG: hypothetical protein FJ264_11605 [Planctomycetes bacterium]|nr:hypothetical protein [Planctomycetota bacterium]